MTTESFDDKTMRFHKATGIWPPGRDAPAAMGEPDPYMVARDAWKQWCKDDAELKHLRAEVMWLETELANIDARDEG